MKTHACFLSVYGETSEPYIGSVMQQSKMRFLVFITLSSEF